MRRANLCAWARKQWPCSYWHLEESDPNPVFGWGTKYAFLGPYVFPASNPRDYFPSIKGEDIATTTAVIRINLLPSKNAFWGLLMSKKGEYLKWLNRLKPKMETHWKMLGIYDLICLSEDATHHYDAAVISGLSPIGEDFLPNLTFAKSLKVNSSNMSYKAFIGNTMRETEEISDEEHVAFLMCWISSFVFCCRSFVVATRIQTLAQLNLCKLLLGHLYAALDDAYLQLLGSKTPCFIGPFWLLDLWLCAMFHLLCYQLFQSEHLWASITLPLFHHKHSSKWWVRRSR